MPRPIGSIEAQLRRILLDAADRLELPLTVKQIEALASSTELALVAESCLPTASSLLLTPAEIDTLTSAANGYTNQETADQLGRSLNTIKTLLKKGSRRLGARNRVHAAAIAVAAGLISPPQIVPVEGGDRP